MDLIALKEQLNLERTAQFRRLQKGEVSVRGIMHERTATMDGHILAVTEHYLGDFKDDVALVFTGSSGRQELCPHSDNDFFILYSDTLKDPDQETGLNFEFEKALGTYNQALIDSYIGHYSALRSVETCMAELQDGRQKDREIHSQLMDRRFSGWGNKALYQTLNEKVEKLPDEQNIIFIQEKFATYDERLAQPLNTDGGSNGKTNTGRIMVLEPHVKNSYGGLRGLQTANWVEQAFLALGDDQRRANYFEQKQKMLSGEDIQKAEEAYDFLLKVRYYLHDLGGREQDILETDLQPELARKMGFEDAGSFMSQYFKANNQISFFAKIQCAIIAEQLDIKPPGDDTLENIRFQGEVTDPLQMLQIFHDAQSQEKDLHYSALCQIRNRLDLVDGNFRNDPEANRIFMEILTDKSAEKSLRRMQKTGLLQRFVPVFEEIDSLTQLDPAHAYTVDEHHFIGMGHLHKLRAGGYEEEAPEASNLAANLSGQDMRILCCAMLLHDAGKGRAGNHKKTGVDIARELGPRLGLSSTETNATIWLVEQHLLLSDNARLPYRDSSKITQKLVNELKSISRLNLLMVLTTADAMAAGPGRRWDSLRRTRLEDLYEHSKHGLRGLQLPDEYDPEKTLVNITGNKESGANIVSIITPDKPFLFANITGTLSQEGCDIRGVSAMPFTNDLGVASISNKFTVLNAQGAQLSEHKKQHIKSELEKAVHADSPQDYKIPAIVSDATAQRNAVFGFKPFVEISNDVTDEGTIIEVTAPDRPGLLHGIAKSLNSVKGKTLSVVFCHATSSPDRVIDTLMVQQRGKKVPKRRLKQIEEAILGGITNEPGNS